jgi:hypothetical protein
MATHRERAQDTLDAADEILRDGSREATERSANAEVVALQALTHAMLAIDDTLRSIARGS